MRCRGLAIGGLLLLAACGVEEGLYPGELDAKIVYGNDDRRDVYAHPDEILAQIARESAVALIPEFLVEVGEDGVVGIDRSVLQGRFRLCEDAAFAEQGTAALCSGVLIADDLVLTAGHCAGAEDGLPCDFFRYVFNFHLEAEDALAPIEADDVYSCRRIVVDEDYPSGAVTPDFAVIQLDRPVTPDRVPAAVRPATPLDVGAPISMIGNPSGLPTKIESDGAWVTEVPGDHYVTNLDAFKGHSGSGVFDQDYGLAGILVRGRIPDYGRRPEESCNDVSVYDDSEADERVQSIAPVIHALCEEGEGGEELCDEKACSGEPCGAPPRAGVGNPAGPPGEEPEPPGFSGVVGPKSGGCSTTRGSHAPGVLFALLALSMFTARLRRKAV